VKFFAFFPNVIEIPQACICKSFHNFQLKYSEVDSSVKDNVLFFIESFLLIVVIFINYNAITRLFYKDLLLLGIVALISGMLAAMPMLSSKTYSKKMLDHRSMVFFSYSFLAVVIVQYFFYLFFYVEISAKSMASFLKKEDWTGHTITYKIGDNVFSLNGVLFVGKTSIYQFFIDSETKSITAVPIDGVQVISFKKKH
jgi:hypothetical protein